MQNKLAAILDGVFIQGQPPTDLVELGRISGAHGVRGLVKVQTHSDQPEALLKAKTWWLKAHQNSDKANATDKYLGIQVESSQNHGQNILLTKFTNLNDRNQAELLRSYSVWLARTDFPQAQTDEYYWVDLIGCDFYGLYNDKQVFIGQVDQVTDNGAHAILDVLLGTLDDSGNFTANLDTKSHSIHILVPFVAAHITDVDLQAKRIISNWPIDF